MEEESKQGIDRRFNIAKDKQALELRFSFHFSRTEYRDQKSGSFNVTLRERRGT
jgi:hypothetical protein